MFVTAKNKSEVPKVYFLMKKKLINPWKGLINSINAVSQTINKDRGARQPLETLFLGAFY